MKRIIALMVGVMLAAGIAGAQELTVSGVVKTGVYMEHDTIGNTVYTDSKIHNNDTDAGFTEGLLRLDMHFSLQNFGFRVRFQQDAAFANTSPRWAHAYAYGDLLNEQMRVSAGLLGESPWGTGDSELRADLESTDLLFNDDGVHLGFASLMGVRLEYKPFFAPGLNVGFAINGNDRTMLVVNNEDRTIVDILAETVLGVAYEHEYFAARLGFRLDSQYDGYSDQVKRNEGYRLTYRLEERILGTFVEGMNLSLCGYYYGLGADEFSPAYFKNWLYWEWDAYNFLAEFDIHFAMYKDNRIPIFPPVRLAYQTLEFFPAFYYKFFNNLLQAGIGLGFGIEFGDGKTYLNSPYQYFFIEPQVKLNINNNASVALVYNFSNSYVFDDGMSYPNTQELQSRKHWINIRATYTF